ncbi:MAG TPA: HlyC/CorC family transporter [Rhodospirillaceae bacterium]|nr:HlyC/CorC family transporter [Rhodospirillaceae bacterium]
MNDISGSRPPRDGGANEDSMVQGLLGWLKFLRRDKAAESVRETLEELFEQRDDDAAPIDEHERRLLSNVLHLRDVTAYDVMVPRANITGVDAEISLDGLSDLISSTGHSRYPVYRGTLDDAMGLVHIKDVLMLVASGKPFGLQRIIRKVLFISPSVRILDLLLEMRLKRTHMALVVDEYGGIDGLVTIEDLVEQIVGEIEDEHDQDVEPDYVERPDGVAEADARMPLEEFEARVGPLLEEEDRGDIDTLGGLVFFLAGRVPSRGELISHPCGLEFEVVDADPRRIKRLRLRNLPKAQENVA